VEEGGRTVHERKTSTETGYQLDQDKAVARESERKGRRRGGVSESYTAPVVSLPGKGGALGRHVSEVTNEHPRSQIIGRAHTLSKRGGVEGRTNKEEEKREMEKPPEWYRSKGEGYS